MIKSIWAGNTPYSKLLITVGIILISAIFFTLFSTLLATLVYGINMAELQSLMSDPSQPLSISVLKLVQTISSIGAFVIPPFILAYLFSENAVNYLSLDKRPQHISWILVLLIMIISTPFINFLGEINSHLHLPAFLKSVEDWMHESEEQAAKLTKAFLDMKSPGDLIFNLIMIGLLPALGEELLFRGILQKIFHQWWKNVHLAVWLSAILFSAMHMQFYGFLPRMVLGAMLGYMLVWSGSLWLSIIAHFVNNGAAVIFIYLFQNGISSIDPDKIGTESDFGSVSVSLLITAGLMAMLYRASNANRKEMLAD